MHKARTSLDSLPLSLVTQLKGMNPAPLRDKQGLRHRELNPGPLFDRRELNPAPLRDMLAHQLAKRGHQMGKGCLADRGTPGGALGEDVWRCKNSPWTLQAALKLRPNETNPSERGKGHARPACQRAWSP